MCATFLQQPRRMRPVGLSARLPTQCFINARQSAKLSATGSVATRAAPAKKWERAAPPGFGKYETMVVLKPTLTEEERDQELARFESFLRSDESTEVDVNVRGRHRMAYPIKGHWEGIYVLFTFIAKRSTTPKVQRLLSTPVAGAEDNILRHMTFRY